MRRRNGSSLPPLYSFLKRAVLHGHTSDNLNNLHVIARGRNLFGHLSRGARRVIQESDLEQIARIQRFVDRAKYGLGNAILAHMLCRLEFVRTASKLRALFGIEASDNDHLR